MRDPLRPEAREAVLQCRRAGITVRLCSGDNLGTACVVLQLTALDTTHHTCKQCCCQLGVHAVVGRRQRRQLDCLMRRWVTSQWKGRCVEHGASNLGIQITSCISVLAVLSSCWCAMVDAGISPARDGLKG